MSSNPPPQPPSAPISPPAPSFLLPPYHPSTSSSPLPPLPIYPPSFSQPQPQVPTPLLPAPKRALRTHHPTSKKPSYSLSTAWRAFNSVLDEESSSSSSSTGSETPKTFTDLGTASQRHRKRSRREQRHGDGETGTESESESSSDEYSTAGSARARARAKSSYARSTLRKRAPAPAASGVHDLQSGKTVRKRLKGVQRLDRADWEIINPRSVSQATGSKAGKTKGKSRLGLNLDGGGLSREQVGRLMGFVHERLDWEGAVRAVFGPRSAGEGEKDEKGGVEGLKGWWGEVLGKGGLKGMGEMR